MSEESVLEDFTLWAREDFNKCTNTCVSRLKAFDLLCELLDLLISGSVAPTTLPLENCDLPIQVKRGTSEKKRLHRLAKYEMTQDGEDAVQIFVVTGPTLVDATFI